MCQELDERVWSTDMEVLIRAVVGCEHVVHITETKGLSLSLCF